jgi:central kinetochore subunit Mis15/CHL4
MAPPSLLVPSTSALPDSLRLPSSSLSLPKILSKLARSSLLDLAIQWLQPQNQQTSAPFLAADLDEDEEDDSASPPAESVDELRGLYEDLQNRKGAKGEVIDRILEGDWRQGLSLRQLAMVDMRYLLDHLASQKWTALRLAHVTARDGEPLKKRRKIQHDPIPQIHTAIFVKNLQTEISPFVKGHYHVSRPDVSLQLPMTILRIYVMDTPYKNPRVSKATSVTFTDTSRTIYVAFPDSCPYIYISLNSSALSGSKSALASTSDTRSLKKLVIDAIPKALSSQHDRYRLETTSLSAKSLAALLEVRGNGKSNNAQGTFSIFADGSAEKSPLDPSVHPTQQHDNPKDHVIQGKENNYPFPAPANYRELTRQRISSDKSLKRRLSIPTPLSDANTTNHRAAFAATRFGSSATDPDDGKGLNRFEIRLEEPLPSTSSTNTSLSQFKASSRMAPRRSSNLFDAYSALALVSSDQNHSRPAIRLTFLGTHVFAGIRALVESGGIDGERMPRWLTGEEGVSVGVVRDGKMLGRG